MSRDIQVTNSAADTVNFKDNAGLPQHVIPEHTQLMLDDVYGKIKMVDRFNPAEDPLIGGNPLKDMPKDGGIIEVKPIASEQDRTAAGKTLDKGISRLIPEGDRHSIKALTDAITSGDAQAFADAVKATGGDPRKLKDLCTEVDKMLAAKGSTTRMDVAADGTVVISDGSLPTAIAVNPATGMISARGVEHNMDGSVTLKPGELLNVDTDDAFRQIGDSAVNAVNGLKIKALLPIVGDHPDLLPSITGPFPHNPLQPIKPITPIKPFDGYTGINPASLFEQAIQH